MESIASFVVVAAVLIFVGWPLFRPVAPALEDTGRVASPPERQKAEAYAAIKEAEFDLRMGKLSESDFAELTQRYRQQALAAIEQLRRVALLAAAAGCKGGPFPRVRRHVWPGRATAVCSRPCAFQPGKSTPPAPRPSARDC